MRFAQSTQKASQPSGHSGHPPCRPCRRAVASSPAAARPSIESHLLRAAQFFVVTLAVLASIEVRAQAGDVNINPFVATGPLTCGKTSDGSLSCATNVTGVVMHRYSGTNIQLNHADPDIYLDVVGTNLVAEVGEFARGGRGMRILGTMTEIHVTRSQRGVEESVASYYSANNILDFKIGVVADSISIDIIETGVAPERAFFDRSGLVMGSVDADGQVSERFGLRGGTTRITTTKGDVIVAGGTYVDPFGTSTLLDDASYVRLATEDLGGNCWEIVSPRDITGYVEYERLGGNEWDFKLSAWDTTIQRAVIGRDVYRFR